ncbi:MAG: amino acid ABC transporter permease, partial [Alphaproteobacteria bacterium]|nr:amino acid ABC transporter permease [Alphaproteobacteria bacterium]
MIYRFNFRDVWANFDLLLEGALLTLQLSAATMVLGLAIGIAGAMSRGSAVGPVRWAARGYVEAIRNTPLLIQIFIIYFGLPGIGLKFDVGTAA